MKKMMMAIALAIAGFFATWAEAQVVDFEEFHLEDGETVWGIWVSRPDLRAVFDNDWLRFKSATRGVNVERYPNFDFNAMEVGKTYYLPVVEVETLVTDTASFPAGGEVVTLESLAELIEDLPTDLQEKIAEAEISPLVDRINELETREVEALASLSPEAEVQIQKLADVAEIAQARNAELEKKMATLVKVAEEQTARVDALLATTGEGQFWYYWFLFILLLIIAILAWALIPRRGVKREDYDQVVRERDRFREEGEKLKRELEDKQESLREAHSELESQRKELAKLSLVVYPTPDGGVYPRDPENPEEFFIGLNNHGKREFRSISKLEDPKAHNKSRRGKPVGAK